MDAVVGFSGGCVGILVSMNSKLTAFRSSSRHRSSKQSFEYLFVVFGEVIAGSGVIGSLGSNFTLPGLGFCFDPEAF
jgi:uncharacterized membrane protein